MLVEQRIASVGRLAERHQDGCFQHLETCVDTYAPGQVFAVTLCESEERMEGEEVAWILRYNPAEKHEPSPERYRATYSLYRAGRGRLSGRREDSSDGAACEIRVS